MTAIEEILLKALNRPVELRKGQAIYNYAFEKFPELVGKMDPRYDCFYLDERIEIFLEELKRLIKQKRRIEFNQMIGNSNSDLD